MKKLNFKSNIDFKYAGIVSGVVLAFGIIISFILVPSIVKLMVKKMSILTPGSMSRKHLENISMIMEFYIFNVTNPNEVRDGDIAKLEEIGPFVYDYFKLQINQVDDEEADTQTFDLKELYYYRPDLTLPLLGNETICTFSALIGGGLVKTIIETPELITFVKTGIDLISGQPDTPFVCFPALEAIHEGYYINCDQTEFAAKAICAALAAEDYMKKINGSEKHLKLAALNRANDSIQATYTVLRGSKNLKDVGKIIAVNGEPMMDYYDNESCNVINGTTGEPFRPHPKKSDVFWFHIHPLCKSFPTKFKSTKRMRGIKSMKFDMDWNNPLFDPECNLNEFEQNSYAGAINLHECYEAFSFVTAPHNYQADPFFSQNIEGLHPKEKQHANVHYIDKLTGARIESHFRFQVNIQLRPISEYAPMSNIREMMFPYNWYDYIYKVPKSIGVKIQALQIGKMIGNFIGRFALLIGILGCLGSILGIALGLGPETPKILNVVPNGAGSADRPKSAAISSSSE